MLLGNIRVRRLSIKSDKSGVPWITPWISPLLKNHCLIRFILINHSDLSKGMWFNPSIL